MIPDWMSTQTTTIEVAQNLLGCLMVHDSPEGRTSGWIVETEAYLGNIDQASHGYQGRRTPSIENLYQEIGVFYVYQRRGLKLINFVSEVEGNATGVLIRALHPAEGLELMLSRRSGQSGYNLTNGPGKLTQAMGIGMEYNGASIYGPQLYIDFSQQEIPSKIIRRPRVGIPNKGEWTKKPLRFYVEGNPYISKK